MSTEPEADRAAVITAGLDTVRRRISRAVAAAGRDEGDITLIVVTKDVPVTDITVLLDLGEADLGESREQQLRAKAAELADAAALAVRWHFVGRLQRNKAAAVARVVDTVHSLDDERLLPQLARGAAEAGHSCGCLVQVNLDADPGRGGIVAAAVPRLADAVAATAGLQLRGVMAVAPMALDPEVAFARLAEVAADLRSRHPAATWISAGMSGDLEAAVRHGATHLRVGTAILGSRPAAR